jgi:Trk K+ transport system NAD-binding subunit
LSLKNHIIVSGSSDYDNIIDFVKELIHETHNCIDYSVVLLVFKDKEICQRLESTVSHPSFRNMVMIYNEDILDNFELETVNIKNAKSIFFLTSLKNKNHEQNDQETILNILAIKSFNKNLDIFAQVISQKTKEYLIQIGVKVVLSINDLKLKFLSRNILSPGIKLYIYNSRYINIIIKSINF